MSLNTRVRTRLEVGVKPRNVTLRKTGSVVSASSAVLHGPRSAYYVPFEILDDVAQVFSGIASGGDRPRERVNTVQVR